MQDLPLYQEELIWEVLPIMEILIEWMQYPLPRMEYHNGIY